MTLFRNIKTALSIWGIASIVLLFSFSQDQYLLQLYEIADRVTEQIPVISAVSDIIFSNSWIEKQPSRLLPVPFVWHPNITRLLERLRADEKLRLLKVYHFRLLNLLDYNTPHICYKFPLSEHTEAG